MKDCDDENDGCVEISGGSKLRRSEKVELRLNSNDSFFYFHTNSFFCSFYFTRSDFHFML